ncbi:DUF7551 domain-containing protein [Halosolutus gelatinilyticus]|uniref:DUF7551 domain-containing protein n=1 Tax=Halosolutus gelatinilyticus TaxID=2931975 RepID=UPI001FF6C1BA|nr:hypothetical protein [Halosolutus gelatinilyticus]
MIGNTLGDIRVYIESLATESGRYFLVCGRTGDRPVPAAGLSFENRAVARAAARATEQYRAALRRYDPQVPTYDVIICEELPDDPPGRDRRWAADVDGDDPRRRPESAPIPRERRGAIDFCHTVAGVVFEAIAASSHAGLQTAVMETYLDVAETIDHPDELCLRLLESIATELDARLDPAEQASLLARAATTLPIESDRRGSRDEFESLVDVLAELQSVGLLDSARVSLAPDDFGSSGWSCSVRLEGYSLAAAPERIVTLPIVVELFARLSTRSITITDAERIDRPSPVAWRVRITTAETAHPRGLVCIRDRS